MRAFEAALIVVNLVSLYLSFRKPHRGMWLAAAVANLGTLSFHESLEGMRYQMAFSYSFAVLFAIYAFIKAGGGLARVRVPKALKLTAAGFGVAWIGASALLAYALPVFTLPAPGGDCAVGIQYIHLVDKTRSDPFLDQSPRQRELMVKLYYPAQDIPSRPYATYFHHTPELFRLLSAGYGLPAGLFDHLNLVTTHSKDNLPLCGRQASYPVILFSHGAGTSMEVQTAQSEELASHGYIVAAIDHTYASAATVFPDRIVSAREATTDFRTAEPAEIITQIMAEDASFVIDTLEKLNAGEMRSIFLGRLNLEQIGAIGHSVGGAVAYHLAIYEPRVKAAIDLDGTVFLTPNAGAGEMAPFLMLASDSHAQAIQNRASLMRKPGDLPEDERAFLLSIYGGAEGYQAAYDKAQENINGLANVLAASGNLYTIAGSDHMKFVDIGLWFGFRPLRELIGIRGDAEPQRCLEITQAVSRAFFDRHLKGENAEGLQRLEEAYPELKNIDLR